MKKKDSFRVVLTVISIVLAVLLVITIVILVVSNRQMEQALKYGNKNAKEYREHYVLIVDNPDATSSALILQGCRSAGELKDAYVEIFEADLRDEYNRLQLINLAIEMSVDGIILEAEETDDYSEMINEAAANNIPVVTLGNDCMDSSRISYVGIGAYDLGREYAREIIRNAGKSDRRVLILMDKDADDSLQNIIYNGVAETLANEGNHLRLELEIVGIDSQSYFSADEDIRSMLANMTTLPDFVVCLSEQNTSIMANAIVEYNIVGKLDVLGYDTSDTILQGIEKGIITSTVAIDYEIMGESCVTALAEYNKTGFVNGYFLIDVHTVNSTNIKEYMEREGS